jgi:hypothetical protein
MNFLYKTKVKWTRPQTDEERTNFATEIERLVAENKTDGTYSLVNWNGDDVAFREWVSEEAANEWKTFIETLYPPVPCDILPIDQQH